MLAFHGRRLHPVAYGLAPLACALAFGLLAPWPRARMVLGGVLYGGFLCALAGVALALHRPGRRLGIGLLVGGCLGGGLLLLGRALAALARPDLYEGFVGAGAIPVVSVLVAQVTTLLASLGFLLMHRERHEQEIERRAMTDPLTGAFNRRTLFELGEQELARARRTGVTFSVVLLDVDHFKRVNDTHGHDAGDAVLRRFVEVLRGCLRKGDLLTRYGGEEFCVLLPGEGLASARVIAERMRAAVADTPFEAGGRTLSVTSSAGVAALDPERTEGLSWLMSRADEALYAAKRDGRNRVVVAGD